jgi:cystathionine beta-lyase family protein involved in aluminum resistance
VEAFWTKRILSAFSEHQISYRHFAGSTGYGNGDIGREALESVFAQVFGSEAAIVRPQIASGTAALALGLFGLVRPGDEILSATGRPYDTMEQILGINEGEVPVGSLKELHVSYSQVELADGHIDLEAVEKAIGSDTRLVIAQRSRGYAWRPAILPEEFRALAEIVHKHPGVRLMVDNCYGEFVCTTEPSMEGADLCVGSLIKNAGGGLAPTGGYLLGTQEAVDMVASRLTAPGIGLEVGSYTPGYQMFFQGLFMAPHTVCQCMKSAILFAALFEDLGYTSMPSVHAKRSDIIQSVRFDTKEELVAFCRAVQSAAPIDSFVVPEPWAMPGYADPVIMAAGAFVQGATTELSADAPIRDPFVGYMQGALTFEHALLAAEAIAKALIQQKR